MRIIYLHQNFCTPDKGFGTRSYEFGWRLVRNGHSVTVITGNSNLKLTMGMNEPFQKINVRGMEVIVLNCPHPAVNASGDARSGKTIRGFARRAAAVGSRLPRPDVVVATSPPLNVSRPAAFLSRRFRVPMILDVRELWPETPIQMGTMRSSMGISCARSLERKAYRRASRIIVLSPGMITGVLQRGASVEKIEFLPNTADIDYFSPESPDTDFLKEYGIQEDHFLVAYAGNVGSSAGIELIIGAAALLSKSKISWAIAGEGENLHELKRRVAEAGLQDKIHFLGKVSKHDVARLYSCAGCALVLFRNLPVFKTSSPNNFFDGLAAGKPIISNLTGWIADLLNDYNAGVNVPPDNYRELARAVESLSKRPELAQMMGQNARSMAEEKFDRELLFEQFEKMLEST